MAMAVCEVCGNDYDKAFQVTMGGQAHTFDSFECAVHALAPQCAHCGCRIVGHGVEKNGSMYCCAHCAGHEGATELRDRA
jgi:phage terminase large subunit GpA-like protein